MFQVRSALVFLLALTVGASARSGREHRFLVEETTIAQVHAAFLANSLTCRELVEDYLARIAEYDQQGPSLNAIASINPEALDEADSLDRRFAKGGLTGPLHCVPMIVKDNIATAGWETNGGSLALRGFVPEQDATAITRLKAAGALILAKSNMADLALNALTTENRIHGRTKNVYAPDRVPAGSSGGTAVAIAANFGLVGLGTDTGNSVRGPASHAALVGIRPTMGLTSRSGMIPLDVGSDVIGPMARTVEDAAAVLDVLVGEDADDPSTEAIEALPSRPQMQVSLNNGLKGMRIGVLKQAYQGGPVKVDPQIEKVFQRALKDLRTLGAEIVESVDIGRVVMPAGAERCRGFAYDLDQYLARQGDRVPVHSLDEIIASGKYDPSIENDLLALQAGHHDGPDSDACRLSEDYRAAVAETLTATMAKYGLVALVYPTWSRLPQFTFNIVPEESGQTLRFATASGFPAMTVPMGMTEDVLPVGLSLMAGAWHDARLIGIASAYEQATRHRRPPVLAPPITAPFNDR